jgi:hypothetical protein
MRNIQEKSFLCLIEYEEKSFHKFFTTRRGEKTERTTLKECDTWLAEIMESNGRANVRCSISEVIWSIQG